MDTTTRHQPTPSRPSGLPDVGGGAPAHIAGCAARGAVAALVAIALGCAATPRPRTAHRGAPPDRWAEATLACDAAGNAYVAGVERLPGAMRLVLYASASHGERWSDPPALERLARGGRRRPQLAVGGPGEVYVLWEDSRNGPVDVYFNGSLDAGSTWLPEDIRVNTNAAAASHLAAPALACDRLRNVYAVWLDDREGFEALYFNRSRDGGATWLAADVRITGLGFGNKGAPQLVCDEDGTLNVVWVEMRDSRRALLGNASTDRGDTWLPVDVEVSRSDAAWGPSLASLAAGTAMVAWLEAGRSASDIFVSDSRDRGRGWTPPRRLTGTREPLFDATPPVVAAGDRDRAYVAWTARAADGTGRVLVQPGGPAAPRSATVVVDRSHRIAVPVPEHAAPRTAPTPVAIRADEAGNAFLAWVEEGPGGLRVAFDRITDFGRTRLGLAALEQAGHPPREAIAPGLAADAFGHVLALWNEGDSLHVAASPFHGDAAWTHRHF